jgi:threonine dehydrogenase-like Zn-dependent dehydrogenase
MKTKAVRLYGKNDLRLEEFELPPIAEDEILARVVSDSICMSTHKAALQGANHKRVPKGVDRNPTMVGHEFCGEIVSVGKRWASQYSPGNKFTVQPALNDPQDPWAAPGYSFPFFGGDATYILVPRSAIELGCLLRFEGESFFHGSLSEPMSCIIGTFHELYHSRQGSHVHEMGLVPGGNLAILAGVGPMGLGAIDYAIHSDRRPKLIVVTDVDGVRLRRAAAIYSPEAAARCGVELRYVDASGLEQPAEHLRALTGGRGYDDVIVFAPVRPVVEQGNKILAHGGGLSFFAGPSNAAFTAEVNYYDVHYNSTHVMGTTGGNTDDMREALDMMAKGLVNPSSMITHVGGLDCVVGTTLDLPKIPGGKKLVYTNIAMELTAIADFAAKGRANPLFAKLAGIVERNNGLWSGEAERCLLAGAAPI